MAYKMDFDVIIIGGGPAGSSAAIHLRKAGVSVAVFEKETFPRPHVGESLVPFCYDLFEDLGILNNIKKNAVRKPGVRFINKNGDQSTTYCFKNILNGDNHLSFHVLREQFDKQLLDKAKIDGAIIFENHKVFDVNLSNPNQAYITVDNGQEKKEYTSKFLIDATGQDSFLGKKKGFKSKHKDLDRIAFLQHWNCDTSQEGINEGLLQIIYLSSTKQGWMGLQPVDLNRLSVGIIFDNNYVKTAKKKYTNNGVEDWKQQFYYDEIKKSPYTKELLKNSKTINKLMIVGDYSYSMSKKYDTNYALIGDAAGFLDPIFATGIYLALNTSKYVSESIITLLKNESEGLNKMKNAYSKYEGALELLERFINNFYNPDFINLAEIGEDNYNGDEEHSKRLIAFSLVHFLMGGDFYNEHKKYLTYLDFLQNPKQIARYHHLVINQEKYKENSCDMLSEEVFPMLHKISDD